jgi:hypothetical protein
MVPIPAPRHCFFLPISELHIRSSNSATSTCEIPVYLYFRCVFPLCFFQIFELVKVYTRVAEDASLNGSGSCKLSVQHIVVQYTYIVFPLSREPLTEQGAATNKKRPVREGKQEWQEVNERLLDYRGGQLQQTLCTRRLLTSRGIS